MGNVDGDPAATLFDDTKWQTVTVPHTWNRLGEFGTSRSDATNNTQGVGWYRLVLQPPRRTEAERYFLQFDAVSNVADVWLNGRKLGAHSGAFSRFRFDVTEFLQFGERNVLVVRADNSKPAPGSSTQDVLPLAGDFFVHGGIYRSVSLIATAPVHIDLMDYASAGVYAHTQRLLDDRAEIAVLARLRNDDKRARSVSVLTRIIDHDGVEVAREKQSVRLPAHANAQITSALTVTKPRLWNGREDPYLYRVAVELAQRDDVLDAVEVPLGIRSIRVDANQGLFLNGKHLALHGVSRHQDRAGKGWALNEADHEEDMALIAELGANAVRFAHYQHAPEWFDLADRQGMLVWSEVPFVHQSNFTADEPTPKLIANARQQLLEQIRQNFNHASVFTWSVGNEIDIGAFLHSHKAGKSLGLLRDLHQLAKSEDPSRLTTFADCCEPPPMSIPSAESLAGTTDLIGYNRYFGWYYGQPSGIGTTLDALHARHPDLPLSLSEYGAGSAITQHTDDPAGGVVNTMGRPHPEEVQNWYHEQTWPQIQSRPFVWGSFVWNMFDFASDLRTEGDSIDLNDKGLVTYDRKTRKDSFYYYKSQWSSEPVVYIASSRYVNRPYAVTDVRVYSNGTDVRLNLNDKDVGPGVCATNVCVWRDVLLDKGANTLTASAMYRDASISYTAKWSAPDPAQGVRIDTGNLVGHVSPDGHQFGSDHFFTGGEARLLNGVMSAGAFMAQGQAVQNRRVAGAEDDLLYDGYRVGKFAYDIPVPNGKWHVTVHSFERDAAAADTRTFDVIANGKRTVTAWNPAKAAGGVLKPAHVTFDVRVRDGRLHLQFEPNGGPALVAAISVLP